MKRVSPRFLIKTLNLKTNLQAINSKKKYPKKSVLDRISLYASCISNRYLHYSSFRVKNNFEISFYCFYAWNEMMLIQLWRRFMLHASERPTYLFTCVPFFWVKNKFEIYFYCSYAWNEMVLMKYANLCSHS